MKAKNGKAKNEIGHMTTEETSTLREVELRVRAITKMQDIFITNLATVEGVRAKVWEQAAKRIGYKPVKNAEYHVDHETGLITIERPGKGKRA